MVGVKLLTLLGVCAHAQVYEFNNKKVPESTSLEGLMVFNIAGEATVEFKDFSAHVATTSMSDKEMKDYFSLQVSVMPWEDFWTMINSTHFCGDQVDVGGKKGDLEQLMLAKPQAISDVFSHVVPFAGAVPAVSLSQAGQTGITPVKTADRRTLGRRDGSYLLAVSNCGSFNQATISGKVLLKHAWGFLPGNESPKQQMYGILASVFLIMFFVWVILMLRWKNQVISVHKRVAMVLLMSLLETSFFYGFYYYWNLTGHRGVVVFFFATGCSTLRAVYTYGHLLCFAMGLGLTKVELSGAESCNVYLFLFMFSLVDTTRQLVNSMRDAYSIQMTVLLAAAVPPVILTLGILAFVVKQLGDKTEEVKDASKNLLITRLRYLILFGLLLSGIPGALILLDNTSAVNIPLTKRYLGNVVAPEGVFIFIVLIVMYFYAPNEHSKQYAEILEQDCEEIDGDVQADKIGAGGKNDAEYCIGDEEEEDEAPKNPKKGRKVQVEEQGLNNDNDDVA